MNIDDGAKRYVHDLIDDAYTRQEIIEKMVAKKYSKEFAEETLLQVMNEIAKKVVMTNLNGEVIICTEREADEIINKQCIEILNNGFTSQIGEDK